MILNENILMMFLFPFGVLFFGVFGAFITSKEIPFWYRKLKKPWFNPPDWVYSVVWTFLYLMIGCSGYLIWEVNKGISNDQKIIWIIYFMQLLLNYLWTPLFFGMHWMFGALINIIFLWFLIIANMVLFYTLVPIAGLILIPYFLWVSLAVTLNFSFWKLNRNNSELKNAKIDIFKKTM